MEAHMSADGAQLNPHTLALRGVTMSFGGFRAVDNVSFSVAERGLCSVIGPNGAGKTTLFNCISGFFKPTQGRIEFAGKDVTGLRSAELVRQGLVRTFQITSIFPGLSPLENVAVALRSRDRLNYSWWQEAQRPDIDSRASEILDEVGLREFTQGPAHEISHGGRRLLEIAIALALAPRLLLLDEPTSGMSEGEANQIARLVQRLASRMSVILVEHNINMVMSISDRIIVLDRGRILADGTPEIVSRDPAVQAAYLMGTTDAAYA